MPVLPTITILPPTTVFAAITGTSVTLPVIPLPSIANSRDLLIYAGGGGVSFPDIQYDAMLEQGLYHGANPLITGQIQVPAYDKLNINVSLKDVFSKETEKGLFDVEYPTGGTADTKINYIWSSVYTSPLGIYTHASAASALNPSTHVTEFHLVNETLSFFTNDVNVVPRVGDYIAFNYVPTVGAFPFTGYINGMLPQRLPYFKGTECYQARITNVTITGGTGVLTAYTIKLDKSFKFANSERYALVLLNRLNTGIQKELFYDTFEQIEIHRQQLLGDPYDNTTSTAVPFGRMNYLNYNGSNSLGVPNLLSGLINGGGTPVVVFDANDEIRDRISFKGNAYDANNKPTDIHFEFHLPGILVNDNILPFTGYPTPVDPAIGGVLETVLVTNPDPATIHEDTNIGAYSGLYIKYDTGYTKRYGFVLYDLRLVVIDDSEFATALGYNSNRNYTLPGPAFVIGTGNNLLNVGTGTNLDITGASNTSPIVITVSNPYSLPRGTKLFISGVAGNTAANGDWFITEVYGSSDVYRFELWSVMPTYVGAIRTVGTGVPVDGTTSGLFVNNGAGHSGEVVSGLPNYSYFYTYRLRNLRNNSVMPYSKITPFNFSLGGNVNNSSGALYINIPPFYWYNKQTATNIYDLGFEMLDSSDGYGIDVIIGSYVTNPLDPINPTAIIGITDVMCIPISGLTNPYTGSPIIGTGITVMKVQDYDAAVTSSATVGMTDYTFDILSNNPLYTYNPGDFLPTTLLTGAGLWTMGNIIYRNHVSINRAKMSITVPADSWNDSTNPTYNPSTNPFVTDKYISEVALLLDVDSIGNSDMGPMIYAKISPAIKKNQDMDLEIDLDIDF